MEKRELHDGRKDNLVPLESLSLDEISSSADLLRAMAKTAFGGRQLGKAFDVLMEMFHCCECRVVLTVSGAMTVAKQGRMICDMIDRQLVDAVVATGAVIAHGLTESIGLVHYVHDETNPDTQLFEKGYNRIYDTLEMEDNLNDVERLVRMVLDEDQPEGGTWSSARLCRALGKRLSEKDEGPGILRSAFQQNIPVFIPALTDSEVGLDFATWAMRCQLDQSVAEGTNPDADTLFHAVPPFNPFIDLQEYACFAAQAKQLGIFTIGGGVPRNWAQQVAPYFDIIRARLGIDVNSPRFRYGVRICPEPAYWGGLSGCTYSEGVSWGKFTPESDGGRYAEVHADATIVWPLLMKAVFEELERE